MGASGVTVPSPLPLRMPAAAQRLMASKYQASAVLSVKPASFAAGSFSSFARMVASCAQVS